VRSAGDCAIAHAVGPFDNLHGVAAFAGGVFAYLRHSHLHVERFRQPPTTRSSQVTNCAHASPCVPPARIAAMSVTKAWPTPS
jgi:hypothetical protein